MASWIINLVRYEDRKMYFHSFAHEGSLIHTHNQMFKEKGRGRRVFDREIIYDQSSQEVDLRTHSLFS